MDADNPLDSPGEQCYKADQGARAKEPYKCLTKSFLVQYLPVYDVIQPFVYDATPNDKVPIVRYVHPLIDTQRDLLENTMTHDVSPRARARP